MFAIALSTTLVILLVRLVSLGYVLVDLGTHSGLSAIALPKTWLFSTGCRSRANAQFCELAYLGTRGWLGDIALLKP